jgi:hypothetical protein
MHCHSCTIIEQYIGLSYYLTVHIRLVMYLIVLSTSCFIWVLCIRKIIIMDFETVRTFLLGLSRQMLHYSISELYT